MSLQATRQSSRICFFAALATYAGLRSKEAVNARWEWVDFEQGVITVQGPMTALLEQKARDDNRNAPLHSKLRAILEPHRKQEGHII